MNALFKAIIQECADLEKLGMDAAQKKDWQSITNDVVKAVIDATAITMNIGDAQAEAKALLADPAADADLLAFATAAFAGASPKAQKIIGLSAQIALSIFQLVEAALAPAAAAPATLAAPVT